MDKELGRWSQIETTTSRQYTCGHCGNPISSEKAYISRTQATSIQQGKIYICHSCNKPTYFTVTGEQTPGARLGGSIEHLPEDVGSLYKEIQNATAAASFTAAVLAARKLLMHIAVDAGAEAGKKFVEYVNYLVENNYTPPNSAAWVDEIRKIGNEANHEIVIMDEPRAKSIIKLIEMLLKFNYEFPAEAAPTAEQQ